MEQELLKRIKELETENENLKINSNRRPLSSKQQDVPVEQSCSIDENLLYYLKSVLGYSIKKEGNRITLRSVYSFCSEDIFEIDIQDNKLMLRMTDYLQEWNELFNIYVKNGRSYSAFFAAVTLDLYNRKTFGQ